MMFGVDWFAMAGTFCLGIVVIWLVKLFAVRLNKPEIKWLSALMAALLGGVVLGFRGTSLDRKFGRASFGSIRLEWLSDCFY
jgi:hypothetical protein